MAYYNYNGGKLVGKIYSFDGEVGTIITPQGEYQFTLKDVKFEDPTKGKTVDFYPNTVPFGDEKFNFARNVNLVNKDMSLKKER